ncbi:MAG: FAD-linked oxidase C-terminal domain-containing protein [Thiohalobacterales bacterium]|nr:FAD-linked oxidase C-terminal domain-containing protein [Thiohalobacterales bacterium]
MSEAQIIDRLRSRLPDSCVLHEAEDLRPYECDGLSAYRQLPLAVVIPETIEQVRTLLEVCNEHAVPVVARGAGTGLSGGALPLAGGVLLSMARFNRILDIDTANRVARVQPGVTNLSITKAAQPHGLYYAPDPSSQIACSIGGNVAENAGGVHCLKYGLTTHNIQALEVLTMAGEHMTIGATSLDSPGYDLLALLTGSEGLLGVITEVTVKLLPIPETARVVMASFASVDAAGAAVTAVIASGIIPAGLELLDHPAIQAVERFIDAGYPADARAILLCELDGSTVDVDEQIGHVQQVFTEAGATELKVSRDEAERQRFWAGRKAAFPAMGRLSPDYYCMDGTIPRKHLARVLNEIGKLSDEYGLPICNVFHAGDGNLHPLILYDANTPGELERTEELGGRILEACVAVGGTITGEHGVGMEKINQMCVQFNSGELEQFHRVKAAFDPAGLLNPGKAIPTLHRCAEFGAMHVHKGQLPHPELERF